MSSHKKPAHLGHGDWPRNGLTGQRMSDTARGDQEEHCKTANEKSKMKLIKGQKKRIRDTLIRIGNHVKNKLHIKTKKSQNNAKRSESNIDGKEQETTLDNKVTQDLPCKTTQNEKRMCVHKFNSNAKTEGKINQNDSSGECQDDTHRNDSEAATVASDNETHDTLRKDLHVMMSDNMLVKDIPCGNHEEKDKRLSQRCRMSGGQCSESMTTETNALMSKTHDCKHSAQMKQRFERLTNFNELDEEKLKPQHKGKQCEQN